MKKSDKEQIAQEVVRKFQSSGKVHNEYNPKDHPITQINIEKIENGFLVQVQGGFQIGGKRTFIKTLEEIPEIAKKIFK